MKPEPTAGLDEQSELLLAACDEALVAGLPAATVLAPDAPAELRGRLEQEFAWCRMVRRLLPSTAASETTGSATPYVPTERGPAAPGAPSVKRLGRYQIRRELGRGGFGVVFLAYDPRLGREVALKVPRPEGIVHPELRARFQHEARAAASLDHPNLVPVYETGEEGGLCYIASAYCPGITLSAWLKERTEPVPFELAARLVATLAEAVEHAHRRGIVHRDLKPSNVMLATNPPADPVATDLVPRIMDFGLAKLIDDAAKAATADWHTQTGAVLGTPTYMAPEQAGGMARATGAGTDVHALGAILYELVTARPPFRGDGPVETLLLVRTQEPLNPSRLRPRLPRDLETICLKCLRKDPRHRYLSARALADDLRRYLTRKPIQARRLGAAGRAVLWCRRKPALASTLTAAVVAVVVVAGVGFYQVLQERERYRDERDRAQGNLYRALVGEARALMQARDTGWWWQAMDNLRQAGIMEGAARDPAELRELAIQCMGTEYACLRLHATWPGHTAPITCTAFSPDGRLVASGSRDQTVRLWSVPEGRPLAVLAGHAKPVTGVAFHPGGQWLASSSADGTVRLWDLAAFAPLAEPSGAPDRVELHPMAAQVIEVQAGALNALEWSPDGAWLAAAGQDGTIRLLGRPGQDEQRTLRGHSAAVTRLAFSETGQLASGAQDRTIRFWNLATGKETDYWTTSTAPTTLVFTPDYGGALTWGQPEGFGVSKTILDKSNTWGHGNIHAGAVRQIRLVSASPYQGGKHRLLTASVDGTVKLWSFQRNGGDHLHEEAVARDPAARGAWGPVNTVALNAALSWVAAGYGDGRIRLWELAEPPQRALVQTGAVQSAAFVGRESVLANAGWLHDFSRGFDGPLQPFFPGAITALEVHPDNRRLAHGSQNGTLIIEDLTRTGARLECNGHTRALADLASSPDGKLLASASADGTVKLWSWDTGACQHTLGPRLGPLHALAWGHGVLAMTGERGVAVCELAQQPRVRLLQEHSVHSSSVAVFADWLAFSGPAGTVEIYDLGTGKKRHSLHAHQRVVSALAFSPAGDVLASAAGGEPLRLWDATKDFAAKELANPPAELWRRLTFDPRGRYLAAFKAGTRYGGVYFWDLRAQPPAPAGHLGGRCGRYAADGAAFLTGMVQGSVQRWPVAAIEQAHAQTRGNAPVTESKAVPLPVVPTTLVNGGHTDAVWGVAASPDGRWLATAGHDQTVKLWDARTRQLLRTLRGHRALVWCVAFSADSKCLASGSAEDASGCVKVWDVETGRELRQFLGHQRLVFGVAFHPSGRYLASSSLDGSVCLWDVAGGKSLGLLHQFDRSVYSVAFHPDGRWLAAACLDNRVALWDLAELPAGPVAPTRFLAGHTAGVYGVGFSADGRYLASGAEQGVMILWDAKTLAPITTLRSDVAQVRSIAFSRDGRFLAGASYGSATIVWDLHRLRRTLADLNLDW